MPRVASNKVQPTEDNSVPSSRVTRENRVPVSGYRDILTVEGKDPNFHYYWVLDTNEDGSSVRRYKLGGYEHVMSDEVTVGQHAVYKSDNVGSIVRVPNGKSPDFLYLMKIPMEWWDEDQAAIQRNVDATEGDIFRDRSDVGGRDELYGKVGVSR